MPDTTGTRLHRGTRARHDALLTLVRGGTTHVAGLAAELDVSASTVRRDLARLTRSGHVARTYGGALVPEAFHERSVSESARLRRGAKAAIAAVAERLVPAQGTVFLDAGTTCGALASRLAGRQDLSVVTRGLEAASQLASSPGVDVVVVGGSVRPLSHGLVGPLASIALSRLAFDVAFLGADAVDPVRGVGEPTVEETTVKEQAVAVARRVVVLADSSKLEPAALPAWARLPVGWTLVTDADLDDAARSALEDEDVQVVLAGRGTP